MDEKLKICVYGKMRSGKSEVVKYLQEKFDADVFDFGDGLKEVVNIINPRDNGRKNRAMLQKVGQHMREMDPQVWINIVDHKIKKSDKKVIICTGCRQPNEYDYLNKMAFLFIKVVADEDIRIARMKKAGDYVRQSSIHHETEKYLDNFLYDVVIFNNYNKLDLLKEDVDRSMIALETELYRRHTAVCNQINTLMSNKSSKNIKK